MKIYCETTLEEFDAWSGAVETKQMILDAGKADEFDALIEELYPEGIDETGLNDILWLEEDWIKEQLDIRDEEDEEDEDDEDNEDDESNNA